MSIIESVLLALKGTVLIPVAGGSIFSVLCLWAAWRVLGDRTARLVAFTPPVTILKPVYGLDRELEANLRSFCTQDYPDYQIVMSLQRADDPARPVLERLRAQYPERVSLAVKESEPVLNGKIQSLVIGMEAARHDVLVISDSDTRVPPDYLQTIVAPLEDPATGYVCTLYRIIRARNLAERLELLTMNADFVPSLLFTYWSNAAVFCLGASVALRRRDLESVGGMASLAEYLVEDQELGRRLTVTGKPMRLAPMMADMLPDYATVREWWRHVVYWDLNTRAANRRGFAATVLVRAVPFALIFAALTGFSAAGLAIVAAVLVIRLVTAAGVAALSSDTEALKALWILPLRDVFGFASWAMALCKRSFTWRGHKFQLTRQGRIVPRRPLPDNSA